MLLLEIFLTVRAWKKGWGAKALVPGAVALTFGVLLGVAIASSGVSPKGLGPIGFAIDLIVVGVLATMVRRPPVPVSVEAGNKTAVDVTSAVSSQA